MNTRKAASSKGQKKGPWSPEEDFLLTKYIETHGEGQWRKLPKKAGLQRCGKGCRLRWMNYLRPNMKRGNISAEEEELIIRLHKLLGNRMNTRKAASSKGQKKGPWSPEEDFLLTKYIETHGEGQWRKLPKKAGLQRCGKGCRLRWMNYLRPNMKRGNISAEEEELIIRLHKLLGNRWSLIAGRVPGRTDNEIKNYWNTHLRKKFHRNATLNDNRNSISPSDLINNTNKILNTQYPSVKQNCCPPSTDPNIEANIHIQQSEDPLETCLCPKKVHHSSVSSLVQLKDDINQKNSCSDFEDEYISYLLGDLAASCEMPTPTTNQLENHNYTLSKYRVHNCDEDSKYLNSNNNMFSDEMHYLSALLLDSMDDFSAVNLPQSQCLEAKSHECLASY